MLHYSEQRIHYFIYKCRFCVPFNDTFYIWLNLCHVFLEILKVLFFVESHMPCYPNSFINQLAFVSLLVEHCKESSDKCIWLSNFIINIINRYEVHQSFYGITFWSSLNQMFYQLFAIVPINIF
jgi:hypothetical protein